MSQLIETIRLLDGQFNNLSFHEARMNNSLKQLYGKTVKTNLYQYLTSMEFPSLGLYKCRILYDHQSRTTEFLPYTFKPITSLKLVEDNVNSYDHKYADRSFINKLMEKKGDCDDILIIKKGWITDSSYANIVFKREDKWYTPHSYLLKGTMRESLLQSGKVIEEEISVNDISNFQKFKLINAMLGFDGKEYDISNIF